MLVMNLLQSLLGRAVQLEFHHIDKLVSLQDKVNASFARMIFHLGIEADKLEYDVTPTCNFRCDMCYIRMEKSQAEKRGGLRSIEEWLHIADQLQEIGTLFILLTGGEPLLYPDFKELYIRLKEKGFILTINTNATLIDDETVRLFQRFENPGWVEVSRYMV